MSDTADKRGGTEPGQPLYTLPSNLPPLTAARGTILALDWQAFRELGFYDAYLALLPPALSTALFKVTAGTWVPIELLHGHYQALDALKLDDETIVRVGRTVGERVHGAFLSTLIRLAGKCGVSPWLPLEQSYKLWTRSWQGGAISVHRVAERVARVTLIETPVCRSRFFRTSFCGAVAAGVSPFGNETSAAIIAASQTPSSVAYRVTWNA